MEAAKGQRCREAREEHRSGRTDREESDSTRVPLARDRVVGASPLLASVSSEDWLSCAA
jgi:hypothetical protein